MKPKAMLLDKLYHIVGGFARSVRDVGLVPGGDLVFPTQQRANETPSLFGWLGVLTIVAESLDELEREVANEFLRLPSGEGLTRGSPAFSSPMSLSQP
jgi:hypothetical protein